MKSTLSPGKYGGKEDHKILVTTMSTNKNQLEAQVQLLNQQYEAALENGEEFSVLRQIKDRLKELKDQLQSNGSESPVNDGHQ